MNENYNETEIDSDYYKTEIDIEGPCINVYPKNLAFMKILKGILTNWYDPNVDESYSRKDRTTKIIEVKAKGKTDIQNFKKEVQGRLDDVDKESLETIDKLQKMKLSDAVEKYNTVYLRMDKGMCDNWLFDDMYTIMGMVIDKLTDFDIVSLIKLNEGTIVRADKPDTDFRAQAKPLFSATNKLINNVYDSYIKLKSITESNSNPNNYINK